jgi:hypothetical protein
MNRPYPSNDDFALLDYLNDKGGEVMRTQVMQNLFRYRQADKLDEAIYRLKGLRLIRNEFRRTAGRPSEWLIVNRCEADAEL